MLFCNLIVRRLAIADEQQLGNCFLKLSFLPTLKISQVIAASNLLAILSKRTKTRITVDQTQRMLLAGDPKTKEDIIQRAKDELGGDIARRFPRMKQKKFSKERKAGRENRDQMLIKRVSERPTKRADCFITRPVRSSESSHRMPELFLKIHISRFNLH